MNRDLALTHDEGAWPVQPYDPATALAQRQEQPAILDLPTLLRIVQEWWWLILGAMAAGIALGIVYALVTTPMYPTGLGSFEQVYQQYEDPAEVTTVYVNHAHNDYLELVLELGAPGLLLIILFLGWWAVAAVSVWTSPLSTPFGRAATIASAAILAHSAVDYPLRTAAIAAIFGVATALMAQRLRSAEAESSGRRRPARHVKLG